MSHNFTELINATTNARQRLKLLAVSHFLEGKSRTDIAAFLKVSRRSVNIWIKAYLHSGLPGLEVKPRSGRPHRLTPEQLANIKQYVIDNAIKSDGGRLQGKDIKEYIETTFGVTYQKTNIYHLLNKLNLSWIIPIPLKM
ncbi:helix-turn-helix domain-containing protein [Psychromonas aquatilis]|uniref:Helix-turn-helix domain-containing protein n=1 Tax=Psychromonas aquatilis TaxID=2005072 RepID=A0ABU9GQH0_9GAMM